VFHIYVVYVCDGFQMFLDVFVNVLDACLSVPFFFCKWQLLHLNVSKIDRMMHIECAYKVASNVNDVSVGDVRDNTGPLLWRSLANPMRYSLICSLRAAGSRRP
jgi:hypothetical protein